MKTPHSSYRWAFAPFVREPWYALEDEKHDYPADLGKFGAASPCQHVELTPEQKQEIMARYERIFGDSRALHASEPKSRAKAA